MGLNGNIRKLLNIFKRWFSWVGEVDLFPSVRTQKKHTGKDGRMDSGQAWNLRLGPRTMWD